MYKIVFVVIISLALSACKKKGCTDNRAINYDQAADTDNGSCIYDTVVPQPDTTNYRLQIIPVFGNENFELNQQYSTNIGDKVKIEDLKFYLSDINLIKADNSEELVADVILIDLRKSSSLIIERNITEGNYQSLKFNLGLTKELNNQDPSTFVKSHPLSTFQNMYWTWSTQYKFGVIEGRADTTGNGAFNHTLLYHMGTDTLLRKVSLENKNVVLSENDEVTTQKLEIDVNQVLFAGNDIIDIREDFYTQTTDSFALSVRIQDNFSKAFE